MKSYPHSWPNPPEVDEALSMLNSRPNPLCQNPRLVTTLLIFDKRYSSVSNAFKITELKIKAFAIKTNKKS